MAFKKFWVIEAIGSLLGAFIIAVLIRTFIVQPFQIPSDSMEPTLHGDMRFGDKIFVSKFDHLVSSVKRGDIVIFPVANIKALDPSKTYVKRLVGLPGDKVEIRDGHIYIQDQKIDYPHIFRDNVYYNTTKRGPRGEGQYGMKNNPITVPEDSYFVLGDNSSASYDSRWWGFVPKNSIMGTVFMIYWPLSRFQIFKHPLAMSNL